MPGSDEQHAWPEGLEHWTEAELQAHERPNGAPGETAVPAPQPRRNKSFGQIAEELFGDLPDEEVARLPVDGAAQHDHYIYGLPKRPA